jgi:hypothetical protein
LVVVACPNGVDEAGRADACGIFEVARVIERRA